MDASPAKKIEIRLYALVSPFVGFLVSSFEPELLVSSYRYDFLSGFLVVVGRLALGIPQRIMGKYPCLKQRYNQAMEDLEVLRCKLLVTYSS